MATVWGHYPAQGSAEAVRGAGSTCPRVASAHRDGERVRGILMSAGPGMTHALGGRATLTLFTGLARLVGYEPFSVAASADSALYKKL